MPPLPPGVFGWLIGIIFLALLIIGFVIVIKMLSKTLPNLTGTPQTSTSLKEPINELIEEVKMLRKEIEELKRELRE